MSRCLGDRTLWKLSEGEGSREARDHVASCVVCAGRLLRLERDLRHLQSALTGPPPPLALVPARPVHLRWTSMAATLATMLVLTWFGAWWQRDLPPPQMDMRQESIWPWIDGVSTTLFSTVEIGFPETPDRLSDLDDLQAALAGEWSCESPVASANADCGENDTWALLLGEP